MNVERTWTGLASKNEFTQGSNWNPPVAPGTKDAIVFNGSGQNTAIWRLDEPVQLTASAVGGSDGLFAITLTSSQTTSVIFSNTNVTTYLADTHHFRLFAGPTNGTVNYANPRTVIILENGSGSLIFDGYYGDKKSIGFIMGGNGQVSSNDSWQRFVNHNASGGSALVFGYNTIFRAGGGGSRHVIFDGTGDIVFNGRYFIGGSRMLKKGSGALTLGGDPSDKTNATFASGQQAGVILEAGTLNINNDGALGGSWSDGNKDGFLAIGEGATIDNTSGTAVIQKQNQRIFILGDFTFKGTNDLTLCAARFHPDGPTGFTWRRVDLYGSHRNITVQAGRLGLGGEIKSGTNTSITTVPTTVPNAGDAAPTNAGITKLGSGTLVLFDDSQNSYSGTINVSAGGLVVDGNQKAATILVANGASFGGHGTTGIVALGASSTLKPGDLPLIVSDTSVWTWTRDEQDVIVSGSFSGTIGGNYNVLKLDKSVSPAGPNLTLGEDATLEFAIGLNRTSTRVWINDYSDTYALAPTTPAVAFNNNIIRIVDLADGEATPGDYVLFGIGSANLWVESGTGLVNSGTSVQITDFDTAFSGLTVDANDTITGGLAVDEASLPYARPDYGYLLKKTASGIVFRLFSPPTIVCDDESVAALGWSYGFPISIPGGYDSISVTGLPAGLSLNQDVPMIVGTPTTLGTFPVTISVSNPAATVQKTITITVKTPSEIPAPTFTSDYIINARADVRTVKHKLTADNLPQFFRVKSVTGNELPAWMELVQDPDTGEWYLCNKVDSSDPTGETLMPSVTGRWTVIIEAGNDNGTTEQTVSIIIESRWTTPVILSATNVVWAKDLPFNYQIVANNSPAYYNITGTLPDGVALDRLTGRFGGTPTTVGSSTLTMSAVNSNGAGSAPLVIDVVADMTEPYFTSTNTRLAYLNQEFIHTFTAAPYVSEIIVTDSTTLPAGMSYDPLTATISGTHTGDGATWALSGTTWPIPVRAINAKGTVDQMFDLVVKQYYPIPTVTTKRRATCYVGRAYSTQVTVNTTVGIEEYFATGLPPGLTLDAMTGAITGTPATAGEYPITFGATTSGGTGTKSHILTVLAEPTGPFINSSSIAPGTAGQPFSYQITAERPVTTYGATNLPRGLSIDPNTGVISGTPVVGGQYLVTITTTDAAGTFEGTVVISIAPTNSTLVTYAGALATPGYVDATGTDSRFDHPSGAVINISGTIYVADLNNNAIRTIATDGLVSSYVSEVPQPAAIAVDSKGDIFFADTENNCIKQVLALDKTVWIAASGLLGPGGVAVDASDNVYFTDSGNNVIKKISAIDGGISVFAGSGAAGAADGIGAAASFYAPAGLVYDRAANLLYVADMLNNTLRSVDIATRSVKTIAGAADYDEDNVDGIGSAVRFNTPEGLAIDKAGFVYIADTGNSTIRVCDPKTGFVVTLIGAPAQTGAIDGDGITALMNSPTGIIVDTDGTGDIFVVDTGNDALRSLLSAPYIVTPLVSTTIAAGSSLTLDGGAWGAPTPTYSWFKDGVQLTGTSARTLTLSSVQAADAGNYQVVAMNASGTSDSVMQLTVTTSSGTGGGQPGGGGGGGGGGSASLWFLMGLGILAFARKLFRHTTDN
ncbi:hypothetical protein AW736_09400 [Termitidicoccus mucosus]|uniref:Ig-like domain-containing protein n=2 Tax=Termitidicoccus mucosus TaxID=1184151 RepID=A0A178IJX8_9BACT|nr:hypothetical protein AW736_09400 [Opitutaceae bacterium TSB47]